MRILKWILVSSLMGVLAACALSQVVTPPSMPTDVPSIEPSATLIAATNPAEPGEIAPLPTESPTGTPGPKSTFIFLWEPG